MKKRRIALTIGIVGLAVVAWTPSGCSAIRSVVSICTGQPKVELRLSSAFRKDCKDAWAALSEGSDPMDESVNNLRDLLSTELPLGSSASDMRELVKRHVRNPEASISGPYAFGHYRAKLICSASRLTLIDTSTSCLTLVFGFKNGGLSEIDLALDGFKGVEKSFSLLDAEREDSSPKRNADESAD